ncbi:VanZ family protein [Ferrimonas pelagia]
MTPNVTQRRIGRSLLVLGLLVVSYLVFSQPGYGQPFPHFDKVGHFGAFFGLAALLQWATNSHIGLQLIGLLGYGILIELIQTQLPYRHGNVADVIADMAGAVSFYLLLWIFRKWQQR